MRILDQADQVARRVGHRGYADAATDIDLGIAKMRDISPDIGEQIGRR